MESYQLLGAKYQKSASKREDLEFCSMMVGDRGVDSKNDSERS